MIKYFNLLFSYFDFYSLNINSIICNNNRIIICENNNFYINECFFNSLSSNSGGAIYLKSISTYLLIENTVFINCTTSGYGAAIYIDLNINSGIIFNKICGYYNYVTQSADSSFSFSRLSNGKHEIYYLTDFNCGPSFLIYGDHSILTYGGDQKIENINSSFNFGNRITYLTTATANSFISKYCNIYNNSVYNHGCLYLLSNSGILNDYNLIQNNSPLESAIIRSNGLFTLNNFIFINNYNLLLTGSIILSNSFIIHSPSLISNNFMTFLTVNYLLTNTYQLSLFSTIYCKNIFNNYSLNNYKFINFYFLILFLFF